MIYNKRRASGETGTRKVCAMMQQSGRDFKGNPLWTAQEDNIIFDYYPDYKFMHCLLDRRSYNAIKKRVQKLNQNGKMKRNARHQWTPEEKLRLRRMWRHGVAISAIMESFPFATYSSLKSAAVRLKINKGKRIYKLTGDRLFDQIRSRCAELNLSLRDLGKMLRLGTYFSAYACRSHKNATRLYRAIAFLGGRMCRAGIEWSLA